MKTNSQYIYSQSKNNSKNVLHTCIREMVKSVFYPQNTNHFLWLCFS